MSTNIKNTPMENKTTNKPLIDQLVNELEPVKTTGTLLTPSIIWVVFAIGFAGIITLLSEPYRQGSFGQLFESAHFLIESLLGLIAVAWLIYSAFASSIPGQLSVIKHLVAPLFLLFLWVGSYILGLYHPALEPSMLGKREFCYLQTLIYASPLLFVALWWCRRQWPLYPIRTGMLAGLAAGAIPALIMQFACMYAPEHILQHHILPGLSIGIIGALAGAFVLTRK